MEKAKLRDAPVGGAPPINLGGSSLAAAQEKARREASDANLQQQKAAEAKALQQQQAALPQPAQAIGMRSLEETKRDIETIAKMAEVKPAEDDAAEEPKKEAKADDLGNRLSELDDFEWDRLQRELEENDFNNTVLRKKIEARCTPMSVGKLVMAGEVTQVVPINPGKLEVEFQTVKGRDDLTIKQMLYQEQGSDRYIFDKYSIMNLAVGLKSINRYPLPDHRDEKGVFNRDRFTEKLDAVLNYPLPMIGILSVNFVWFDQRVRKLFTVDELGNG